MFRALENKNYKYYYAGQSLSLIGTWVQNIAIGWLLYRLTGSALLLGTVAFAQQIPSLFITPFAGVLADRVDRRKVIILSQVSAMIVAFVLAALVLTDTISVSIILVLAAINGIILAFDTPFRQAFVVDMISDPGHLTNAIALNSSLYNLARFIGPPVGGVLIASVGEGWCFFINGVSFLSVIAGLLAIKVHVKSKGKKAASVIKQLKEGLQYSWNEKSLRFLLILVAFSSFFGLPFQALLPVFAADILNGDSELLGVLTGALGAGALTGAFYLAARKKITTIPLTVFRTALIFSVSLGLFALSTNLYLSLAAMAFTGFGMIVHFNSTNTLLQIISDSDKRGRVVSLYSLTFMGITPLGSILVGSISEILGVPAAVLLFSVVCVISALIYGKRLPKVFIRTARSIRQSLNE